MRPARPSPRAWSPPRCRDGAVASVCPSTRPIRADPPVWPAPSRDAQYYSRADSRDGRKIEWRCETADGKTGPVTINGQQFDLSGGPLFLVTTKGGETRVQQLRRDLSKLEATPGDLERLAEDPDVSQFVAEAKKAAEGP